MALIDSLKQDMRNADDAATQLGVYLYDDPKATATERILWALSVAVLHIIDWILRREKEREKERNAYFKYIVDRKATSAERKLLDDIKSGKDLPSI